MFANELVDLLTAIGKIISVSEVLMGATVLAWGGCIGDLTADVLLARNKREGMAITACFGSPMFSMLIIVAFGVLLKQADGGVKVHVSVQILTGFIFLLSSLVMTLISAFAFGRYFGQLGNKLPSFYAYVLWTVYAAFVLTMVVMELVVE